MVYTSEASLTSARFLDLVATEGALSGISSFTWSSFPHVVASSLAHLAVVSAAEEDRWGWGHPRHLSAAGCAIIAITATAIALCHLVLTFRLEDTHTWTAQEEINSIRTVADVLSRSIDVFHEATKELSALCSVLASSGITDAFIMLSLMDSLNASVVQHPLNFCAEEAFAVGFALYL